MITTVKFQNWNKWLRCLFNVWQQTRLLGSPWIPLSLAATGSPGLNIQPPARNSPLAWWLGCSSQHNPTISVTCSLCTPGPPGCLTWFPLPSPFPSSQPCMGSPVELCLLWILPDVPASGYALPHIYNKLSSTIQRSSHIYFLFSSSNHDCCYALGVHSGWTLCIMGYIHPTDLQSNLWS